MMAPSPSAADSERLLGASEDVEERGTLEANAEACCGRGEDELEMPVRARMTRSRRMLCFGPLEMPRLGCAGLLLAGALMAVAGTVAVLASWQHGRAASMRGGHEVSLHAYARAAPQPVLVSFFCFCVMKPGGPEQELVELQLKRRAGIFKCNDFAVISSELVNLGFWDDGNVTTWYNPVPQVGMGTLGGAVTTNSFLNTQIFIVAWNTLVSSKQLDGHDFVVKADPDCVWFPDRLATHVKAYMGEAVYFPNCNLFQDSPPQGPKLYGALEVFSKQAIDLYGNGGSARCQAMDWHGWGEDYYMQMCMLLLGARGQPDYLLVGDQRCIPAGCEDWTRVAFHDYKDPTAWGTCFNVAIGKPDDPIDR